MANLFTTCFLMTVILASIAPLTAAQEEVVVPEDSLAHCNTIDPNVTLSYKIVGINFEEVSAPLVAFIWILIAALAKVLFHFSPLPKYVPESCLLVTIGFIIGGLFLLAPSSDSTHGEANAGSAFNAELQSDLFFLYLLPPIMMEAGYFMPQTAFWNNIGSILTFAVVGTLINAFAIGLSLWGVSQGGLLQGNTTINFLECMTFSSLISAVDPVAVLAVFEEIHVNQVLHILVFGESLLNDAVTVVLYRVFESFNEIGGENLTEQDMIFGIISFFVVAFGGILVGLIFGFITAFITKYTYQVRVVEPIFVFVMAYLSYIIAEMLTLSSILSIVACSMFMKPYVEQNISKKSHTTIKYFLKMLSSISETIIFIFLGITSLEQKETHQWDSAFVFFTLFFCFVYRSIGVIIQVNFLNHFRLFKINRRSQFIMAYGGIRGAIAFSLVALLCSEVIGAKKIFFTTTVVVIMFTMFIQGITIKPFVNILHVKKEEKRKPTMNEEIYEKFNGHLMPGIEDIIGHHGHHSLRDKWEKINENYLERILVRKEARKKAHDYGIINVWQKLEEKERNEEIQAGKLGSSPSQAELLRNQSESSFKYHSSATLEVPDDRTFKRRGPSEGDVEGQEDQPAIMEGSTEGEVPHRRSSFSLHLDAFKKSVYRPRTAHTVRKSRYFLDDEDISEPKPLAERSLHILHRHKTKKIRMSKAIKSNGRKQTGSNIKNMFKSLSGNKLDEQGKSAAYRDFGSQGSVADAANQSGIGKLDIAEGAAPANDVDVKFSIEHEEPRQGETNF